MAWPSFGGAEFVARHPRLLVVFVVLNLVLGCDWNLELQNVEYSISLQALFPFEIEIQALIQFVIFFDILSCLVCIFVLLE